MKQIMTRSGDTSSDKTEPPFTESSANGQPSSEGAGWSQFAFGYTAFQMDIILRPMILEDKIISKASFCSDYNAIIIISKC